MVLRWLFFSGMFSLLTFGQQKGVLPDLNTVSGKITDHHDRPLSEVKVNILGQIQHVLTDEKGNFKLQLPPNSFSIDLVFSKERFRTQTLPVEVPVGENLILQKWAMEPEVDLQGEWPVFDLQDLQSIGDDFDRGQIGSVLHAQRNPFLNAVAFQLGSSFFRLRGLDSRHNTVSLNGIPMNTFDSGRPLWSQWGGLNDFTNRTQQFQFGITATENNFGGLLGHTQIELRPSSLPKGSKVSQAFSNATYQYRSMLSHVGSIGKKVDFAFLLSTRVGRQGYLEGTPYHAQSGLLSIEKNWNAHHHTWFTALFTPSRRGKSAPLTQEVFDIKGRFYNPNWGLQDGKVRNARDTGVSLPMIFLNHQWQTNRGANFRVNIAYQWGKQSWGRIYYNGHKPDGNFLIGGGQNPDPTYYQKLPSYFLKTADQQNFQSAYFALKTLEEEGQIDWYSMYEANQNQADGTATYALYEDVKAPKRITTSMNWTRDWNNAYQLNINGIYTVENSAYYATPRDLLGARQLWDFNPYASDFDSSHNNLNQPNNKVTAGDPFLYHYELSAKVMELSAQMTYQKKGFDGFLGLKAHSTQYQRVGKFRNGSYPENSWGDGNIYRYLGWQLKGGFNYAITGRLRFFMNGGKYELPPAQQNLYVNPRENHWTNPNTGLEKHLV